MAIDNHGHGLLVVRSDDASQTPIRVDVRRDGGVRISRYYGASGPRSSVDIPANMLADLKTVIAGL